MNWYYESQGQKVGPLDESAMKSLITSSVVKAATPVWRQGMPGWLPATQTELASLGLLPQEPPELPMASSLPSSPQSNKQDFEQTARIGMIVSLAGILLFGLITGVVGIVFSSMALSGMSRTGDEKGKGMAIAGLVVGIVDVVAWALIVLH